MAKQANGYLGGFRGRLGTAIGYQWNGVWCLRARPRRVYNPQTEAQQEHRTLFREEVRLAGRMKWAVNTGLSAVARQMGMTAQNLFVKINQEAFGTEHTPQSLRDSSHSLGEQSCLNVDYSALQVSAGPVAPVAITNVEYGMSNDELTVHFEKNPEHRAANGYDNVFLWIYSPEAGMGYLTNAVYRRAQKISVLLPDYLAGELHLYAFVQDEQGRCSATSYAPAAYTDTLYTAEEEHHTKSDTGKVAVKSRPEKLSEGEIQEKKSDNSLIMDKKLTI
jgi:hypothetical protein